MATKKAQQPRTASLSIEVVSNGYKVRPTGNSTGGLISITSTNMIFGVDSTKRLHGEFVFQDFAGLTSFLRKSLTVPSA